MPFGLALAAFALFPTRGGYQDLGALIASQPAVAARWQQHLLASPFGTIHTATFRFPRPLGSEVPTPPGFELASFNPNDLETTGSLSERPRGAASGYLFPKVDRRLKGDLLGARTPPHEGPDPAPTLVESADDAVGAELSEALRAPPLPEYGDVWPPLEAEAEAPGFIPPGLVDPDQARRAWRPANNASIQAANLYFGTAPMGTSTEALERWEPGDEPIEIGPRPRDEGRARTASLPPADAAPPRTEPAGGATVAPKGEVSAEHKGLQSPAERLGLAGKAREKAEKCLANAVYFESRGEAVRGQIAVAQVVMNRVFSGFYPDNVCGVVYQNAHRHLACQFTFACDGIRDVITEPAAWERAKRIAKETLDGKLWLPEVGKATHYHARWVRPSWVHEMRKLYKFGVHTFYRPRAWGNGADAPAWGDPATTAVEAAKL